MKRVASVLGAAAALASVACSSSSPGAPDAANLYGSWTETNADGTAGVAVVMNADGTYSFEQLQLVSSTSANAEIETGTFVVSGNTIVFTPNEWSCPGPDPVSNVMFAFEGQSLSLSEEFGIVLLQRGAALVPVGGVTAGCFDSTGAFTAASLAAVSN